ncbi:MAG: DNA (cytosine-5-)-methyltransferase [Fimbriimonadaceae bacterium]
MTEFSSLRLQAGLSIREAASTLGYTEREVYRLENGDVKPKKPVLEVLRHYKPPKEEKSRSPAKFTFVDLFAGIGGLRRGFDTIGGRCVFTSEWDRYCQLTYRANYPEDGHKICGDIREIKNEEIPKHDVLLAGFPCQPFSIAGVSKKNALNRPHGFACETQGTLFFEVERVLAAHQPAAFVLENVKNLVNHDKGNTFRVIYDVLTNKLGYKVDTRVLDAKSWVPQHRERIFIVGFRDHDTEFKFKDMRVPDPLCGRKLSYILHSENGTEKPDKHFTTGRQARVADKYTLTDHLWRYLRNYADKHRKRGNGFGYGLFGPDDVARTLSARYYKDGSEILIRQKGEAPRRLTPRECARLMGFDAPGKSEFNLVVSDTQAYKQFGNAVVVPVAEAVARHMEAHLLAALARAPGKVARRA